MKQSTIPKGSGTAKIGFVNRKPGAHALQQDEFVDFHVKSMMIQSATAPNPDTQIAQERTEQERQQRAAAQY